MNEESPSTSHSAQVVNTAVEEFNVDNEILNESLEVFAKTYNLTAQNVKNILYHVIKNPQTFATLFGKDPEAIASLRMTRSRQRELERIAQVKLGIELKPVNAARTFLDVNYDENDEDDVDYRPDETENCNMDDGNESDFPESNADWGELIEDEEEMVLGNDEMPIELLTSVDDPEYLKFLRALASPNGGDHFSNDDELDDDDEFNIIQQEMEMIEEEEFRMDRTTKIPRWELEALRQDWVTSDADKPPPKKRHRETITEPAQPSAAEAWRMLNNNIPRVGDGDDNSSESSSINPETLAEHFFTHGAASVSKSDEVVEVYSSLPTKNSAVIDEEPPSCPLLAELVDFTPDELATIRVQMEKHVQLLTQTIIGSHDVVDLLRVKNRLMEMFEELDREMDSRGEHSSFHIPILLDAIYSCHDITLCRDIDIPPEMKSAYYLAPRNEVVWVLSRCKALKYPQLISDVRMQHFAVPHTHFFPSEQVLLALALYQLYHVKHSSWNHTNGKYQLIADYFLPNKSVNQIRYHLKNLRCSTNRSPINTLIMEVQKCGILKAEFLLDSEGRNAQEGPPIKWPLNLQPEWLKKLGSMFASGQVRFDVEPTDVPMRCSEVSSVQRSQRIRMLSTGTTCNSTSEIDLDDENSIQYSTLPEYSNAGEFASEPANASEEVSNDVQDYVKAVCTSVDKSAAPAETTKHKSRRKMRVEKCMERLRSQKAREESLAAVVEAVNQDVKQRLFMHQDKLKDVQSIISNQELSITQKLIKLSSTLRGEQYANVLALIASLSPDEAFPSDLTVLHDPRRVAYKKAIEMLVNSHTYLMGCRSKQSIRNVFKNIREATDRSSSEEIANRLKHHFGSRDNDPLWKILRTQIPHEKFNERVDDWQYESVDMDSLLDDWLNADRIPDRLRFENVNLPYKCDSHNRGRLRLRHGRLTMEHNGRLKTVNVVLTADIGIDSHHPGN